MEIYIIDLNWILRRMAQWSLSLNLSPDPSHKEHIAPPLFVFLLCGADPTNML
jgi:hypothetical protein